MRSMRLCRVSTQSGKDSASSALALEKESFSDSEGFHASVSDEGNYDPDDN
jgi:hypothetical protein